MYEHFSIPGESCRIPFADLCRRNSEFRTYFIRKTYDASQCIHPQGTKITSFGIVETGILKAVDHTRKMRKCAMLILRPGIFFRNSCIFPEKRSTVILWPLKSGPQCYGCRSR